MDKAQQLGNVGVRRQLVLLDLRLHGPRPLHTDRHWSLGCVVTMVKVRSLLLYRSTLPKLELSAGCRPVLLLLQLMGGVTRL